MNRILIAADHERIRAGRRQLIAESPGWVVCGGTVTGRIFDRHAGHRDPRRGTSRGQGHGGTAGRALEAAQDPPARDE